jgi:hypothetical protein
LVAQPSALFGAVVHGRSSNSGRTRSTSSCRTRLRGACADRSCRHRRTRRSRRW